MSNPLYEGNSKPKKNRPDRSSLPPKRPLPQIQDNNNTAPWFVSDDKEKPSTSGIVKRIFSSSGRILAPLIAVAVIAIIIITILTFLAGIYE